MRILVHGAGGIGLYFAARLARSGHAVTLKGRAATPDAFRRDPLRIRHQDGTTTVDGVTVTDRVPDGEPFDLVVLATKSWQVPEAAAEIAPAVGPRTRVLTTQNGVDAPAQLAEHVPDAAVLAGTVIVIAKRLEPSLVEVVGNEATITVGAPARSDQDPLDQAVVAALADAGIGARWTGDVTSALWKKLALIASYGGIGALSGATVGETRSTPETRDLVERAMREVFAVGNARGARLDGADLADILHTYEKGFAPGTTASMQRDLAEGRPSELEGQSGAVVAHARAVGVDVPVHQAVYASQIVRERAVRGAGSRAGAVSGAAPGAVP